MKKIVCLKPEADVNLFPSPRKSGTIHTSKLETIHTMKTEITESQAEEFRKLASKFSALDSAFMETIVAIAGAQLPDEMKMRIMDRLGDKPSFQSMAYLLTPQTEWKGGDSSNPENFRIMNPHFAR